MMNLPAEVKETGCLDEVGLIASCHLCGVTTYIPAESPLPPGWTVIEYPDFLDEFFCGRCDAA